MDEKNKPVLSVLMGVYNPDMKMLEESINSIIIQSFTDWELLICNDGSSDEAVSRNLRKIEKADNRIKIIEHSNNQGLASALNSCFKNAAGVYIARQDDDDISSPDRFEKQIKYLIEHPACSFVGSRARIFDSIGEWGQYDVEEFPSVGSFLWNSPFIHPSVVFRRTALEAVSGYRSAPETDRCEDYDLFMSMYSLGLVGHNIQENLYIYRIDRNTGKYRPMKIRVNEAKVRYRGFKKLGLGFRSIPYVVKPIAIGLIPGFIFRRVRKSRY